MTSATAAEIGRAQAITGARLEAMAELLTGAILVREAMAPDRRVQVLLRDGGGRTQFVADSHPDGSNRGIASPGASADAGRSAAGERRLLEVIYTLPGGILHQGVVEIAQGSDISTGLMTYMQESEQVLSIIAVAAAVPNGESGPGVIAGGYMIQLLPGAEREALMQMTETMAGAAELRAILLQPGMSADRLREAVLGDILIQRMMDTPLRFGCNCDRARVLSSLRSLNEAELLDILQAGQPLDIRCDACGRAYVIDMDEVSTMLRLRQAEASGSSAN